jgi:FAD:protein FMN transferase
MSCTLHITANIKQTILNQAFTLAQNIEDDLSVYKPNSFVSQINAQAGITAITLPDLYVPLFIQAKEIAQKTEGLFDPTIGILTQKSYSFGKSTAKVPSKTTLQKRQKLVNYQDLIINKNSIYLQKKGMVLDLGGIAKGFAVSQIMQFLQHSNATKVLVNLGGEIQTLGKEYTIGINHPRENKLITTLKSSKALTSISTSGDYERYISDPKHHHILNSRSGESSKWASSLTLIALGDRISELDAYATALFNVDIETCDIIPNEVGIYHIDREIATTILNSSYLNIKI